MLTSKRLSTGPIYKVSEIHHGMSAYHTLLLPHSYHTLLLHNALLGAYFLLIHMYNVIINVVNIDEEEGIKNNEAFMQEYKGANTSYLTELSLSM